MNIITNETSSIVVNNDTVSCNSENHFFSIPRSKDSIQPTAFTNNEQRTYEIKSGNSAAFWVNAYPQIFWLGFIIDWNNPKRFTYPQKIYIDFSDSINNDFNTFKPLNSAAINRNNIIKFTPWRTISLMNSGIEINYERLNNKYFSTQFSATYLLPVNGIDFTPDFYPKIKGFILSVEERYFYKKSAPQGPYIALDFNYLKNSYRDVWSFWLADSYSELLNDYTIYYTDTFGIRKQTYTTNFKLGYQYIMKRFTIDIYCGIGVRNKNVKHFDRFDQNDVMDEPRHPNIYYITNRNGEFWTINFPISFKIGWIF